MTTVKVKLRMSSHDKGKGTLYYQVICKRTARLIHSGYSIRATEWDSIRKTVVIAEETGRERKEELHRLDSTLSNGLLKLRGIVKRLEHSLPDTYTAEDVVKEYHRNKDNCGFIAFGRRQAELLLQLNKHQKAERYTYALNSFCRFRNDKDLMPDELDGNVMMAYENYLKEHDLCINSISFYMRNLRSIYNDAVEKGLVEGGNPFKHVYTGIDRTVKRAISLEVLRQIKQLDLAQYPLLDLARNLFMFSVYTRGMSFVDMAYLRKKDLHGDILIYHRQKTGHLLKIRWENMMQMIVDKYDTGDSPYLLPIIRNPDDDRRKQYRSALRLMNKKLKKIGTMVGLMKPLTTYVARHAWASIAKEQHIPISVISEAMGHNSENTTRIYLASLDASEIDNANRNIMDALE
ncbi:MAG: site-specific integrase [Prevotellaceae bacterium]|nr:site-specific integrase [Prevotellaceae bacterium]